MAIDTPETETLIIRLKSVFNEVDAKAVALSMLAFVDLLNESQGTVSAEEKLVVRAKPFRAGSFEIPYDLVAITALTLLPYESQITHVLTNLKTYLEIVRLRSQKVPVEGPPNHGIVVNNSNVGPTYNFIFTPSQGTRDELGQAFQAILDDERIDGVQVIKGSSDETLVDISREEFPNFLPSPSDDVQTDDTDKNSRATLVIVSPVLDGKAKWKFRWKGSLINATMGDDGFLAKSQGGQELFAAGDRLIVMLTTHYKYDEKLQTDIVRGYTISKVIAHEKKKRQKKLPDA